MPSFESELPMKRIREIFSKARQLPAGPDREAFLDEACAGDPALRKEVEALLKAEIDAGNFLNHDAVGKAVGPAEDLLGTTIGHYRILEHLGEGGFGDVYRVEQLEPIHRELAIKIIKPGMGSRDLQARFLSERETLALMDHPNIARILDAGTTDDGRPYFVMDLVIGSPITRYCDENNLSLRERLELFKTVCSAVQHAHQKGILHRDLKPSNIVVVETEGEAVPKIIDFGIAKVLKGELKDRALITQVGLFVGTPAYMSPEQVSMSSESLDTRSDIYSLGVLLYELIAGVQPFERDTLQRAALAEVQRIICEEDPDKPSTRLRKIGEQAKTIAELRSANTTTLIRTIKGDLDWIVMKAIEKDRTRRYQGVGELARDIERHLRHDTVEAGAPGRIYRFRKFVRRHYMTATILAVLIPTILMGLVASLVGFSQAKKERNRATISELIAQVEAAKGLTYQNHLGAFLQLTGNENLFENKDRIFFRMGEPESRSVHDIREILDALSKRADNELKDQPATEMEIRGMLADSYLSLELRLDAWENMERLLELSKDIHGQDSVEYADNLVYYAFALEGKFPGLPPFGGTEYRTHLRTPEKLRLKALELAKEALAIYRKHNHLDSRVIRALKYVGSAVPKIEQEPFLLELIEACSKLYGKDHFRTLLNSNAYIHYLVLSGRSDEAKSLLQKNIPVLESVEDGPYWHENWVSDRLAIILEREGDLSAAEDIYRSILSRLENKVHGEFTREYEAALIGLDRLLTGQGIEDPDVKAKLTRIEYRIAFDPTLSRVDYRLQINQTGTYRLFVRWDGHNFMSDSFHVRMQRVMDGAGGEIADFYGFTRSGFPPDADFSSVPEWDYEALFESIANDKAVEMVPAEWEIKEPGNYTLQFIETESGVALDAFVFQLSNLDVPQLQELHPTPMSEEHTFEEVEGRIVIEAENFSERHKGRVTEWIIVPDEQQAIIDFLNYSGSGYLQVLPEREWLDPDALVPGRAYTRDYHGRWEESILYYDEAVRIDPSYANYWARAQAHDREGNDELAAADYTEAMKILKKVRPGTFDIKIAQMRRAECWLRLGRYDEVIADLKDTVEGGVAPDFMRIDLALAYAYKGMWEKSFACIEPQERDNFLWYIRGDLHGMAGDYETAKEWYLKSIEMDPGGDRQHLRLAILYLMDGDEKSYRTSQARYPKVAIPTEDEHLGGLVEFLYISIFGPESCPQPEMLEQVSRNVEERLVDVEQIRGLYLDWANIPLAGFKEQYLRKLKGELVGAAYYRIGKFDKAVELLSKSIEIEATTFQAYRSRWMFFLAMALHKTGDASTARTWYDKAIAKLEEERISVPANDDKAWPNPWYEKMSVELLQQEAARVLGLDPSPD